MNHPVATIALFLTSLILGAMAPSADGQRLAEFYDSLQVEKHWLKGRHIDWRTGDPDNGKKGGTHCSGFVAATCERLGIEILRPPAHGQKNLANAQFQWLAEEGARHGWTSVDTPFEAQQQANLGRVVVAVCRNPNPRRSGHIALVRPAHRAEGAIQSQGPLMIQAGSRNASAIDLKSGFSRHPEAWQDATHFSVRFYAHPAPALPPQ